MSNEEDTANSSRHHHETKFADEKEGSSSSSSSSINRCRSITAAALSDNGDDDVESTYPKEQGQQLNPPMGRIEQFRERLVGCLGGPFFQILDVIVLLLVIVDGAFFFFLLLGWQSMCSAPSKTDCDPRNYWYNWSIQVLTLLFTYMAVVSFPWRYANLVHLTPCLNCGGVPRSNEVGHDLHGLENPDEVWFHIENPTRLKIIVLLLFNAIFQFLNQGTRIAFPDYAAQSTMPGIIWTNVFFALSFLCGAMAGLWLLWEAAELRKLHPGKFGLGPIDAALLAMGAHTPIQESLPP